MIFLFTFYFYFIFKKFYFLTLQYCIGFAIYQNESATGIHVFPILNPPPSSLPIPSLWVVPSIQYHTSNLNWRLISYMILYMFQCHSPKSSHPLPLRQSPKDCSIHQCLFNYKISETISDTSSTPVSSPYSLLCYAKSLQSCPTLCDPIDGSPPGSPVPGILQARTLEWVAISFSNA